MYIIFINYPIFSLFFFFVIFFVYFVFCLFYILHVHKRKRRKIVYFSLLPLNYWHWSNIFQNNNYFVSPLCGVEAAVGWLHSLQMPAFLDPRIPTGLQRTCTKYTVPGLNPASLQEVWFPTSSTTCAKRHPKQCVTSNGSPRNHTHDHPTAFFNVL